MNSIRFYPSVRTKGRSSLRLPFIPYSHKPLRKKNKTREIHWCSIGPRYPNHDYNNLPLNYQTLFRIYGKLQNEQFFKPHKIKIKNLPTWKKWQNKMWADKSKSSCRYRETWTPGAWEYLKYYKTQ